MEDNMSILIESCNEYLYENIISAIPLCEADDGKSNKSLWQKIKDFFKRIWQWIKDKVLTLFGKKKKENKAKIDELKDLLKDSKRPTDKNFKSWLDGIKEGLDVSERYTDMYQELKKDDESVRERLEKELAEMNETAEQEISESIDFTLNNMHDIEDYEWALEEINKEVVRLEKDIKKMTDNVNIPEANVEITRKFGEGLLNNLKLMIKVIQNTLLDRSITAAKEESKKINNLSREDLISEIINCIRFSKSDIRSYIKDFESRFDYDEDDDVLDLNGKENEDMLYQLLPALRKNFSKVKLEKAIKIHNKIRKDKI